MTLRTTLNVERRESVAFAKRANTVPLRTRRTTVLPRCAGLTLPLSVSLRPLRPSLSLTLCGATRTFVLTPARCVASAAFVARNW